MRLPGTSAPSGASRCTSSRSSSSPRSARWPACSGRLDPVAPDRQDFVAVLLNGQLVGRIRLSWDPQRVGSHRVALPVEWVKIGDNEITLVPETTVTAGSAGARFAWLDPTDTIGVRLWYVRVME